MVSRNGDSFKHKNMNLNYQIKTLLRLFKSISCLSIDYHQCGYYYICRLSCFNRKMWKKSTRKNCLVDRVLAKRKKNNISHQNKMKVIQIEFSLHNAAFTFLNSFSITFGSRSFQKWLLQQSIYLRILFKTLEYVCSFVFRMH